MAVSLKSYVQQIQINIMKIRYYIYIDESKVNSRTGMMPIYLIFKTAGKMFKISTGLSTSVKFSGLVFPKSEMNARAKTMRLTKIATAVDEYLLLHCDSSLEKIKSDVRYIITGEEKATEGLVKYIMDFASTKENSGTRGLYELTARKVSDFDDKANFETVTPAWLKDFERHNIENGMSVNGIAIHLRNIRTVFNWCIDNEYTDKYPFRKFKVKSEKVPIRNLTAETAEQIAVLRDYAVESWQEIYRDFFMLSFYLCGINPVDLLHLKTDNINNGRLTYKRRKTGHLFDLPVPKEAQEIITKYKGRNYLLSPLDKYSDYKDFLHHWNDALKKIGTTELVQDKAGKRRKVVYHPLYPNMTVYTARYSFASIAAELDIPRETVALCLGHSWADVTSHYIAYDTRKIDKAVKQVIDYLNERY